MTSKDIAEKGGDAKIHCDLKDTCTLIHSLGGIVSVHAGGKSNSLENITNTLPYKMALKTDLVLNHIDILELGNQKDHVDYQSIVFPAINHVMPMVVCSDNHNIRDYKLKDTLWVKSDPTFEGLKQIVYEPQHRVHIGENHPISPPIRIDKVIFDFPMDAVFEKDLFCLSGSKEILMSPNFTCLVGGRGTGKSTILNLIHEKLKAGDNLFFQDKKILDKSLKPIPIDSSVRIDDDLDEKYIEFLSQNEVEEFARDYKKLTSSVYSRILKRDQDGKLTDLEKTLKDSLEKLNDNILNQIKHIELDEELAGKKREFESNKKIVDSFSSDEYTTINSEIKSISDQLHELNTSLGRKDELTSDLKALIEKYDGCKSKNLFEDAITDASKDIESIVKQLQDTNFSDVEGVIEGLKEKLVTERGKLLEYLSTKGLTEENQKDIADASLANSNLEKDIAARVNDIDELVGNIGKFTVKEVVGSSSSFENELNKQLKSISDILENLENASLKPISLALEFDEVSCFEEIFNDFKIAFEERIQKSSHKGDVILKEILFVIPPDEVNDKEVLLSRIKGYSSASSAKSLILDIFEDDRKFDIYKKIIIFNLLDYSKFKKIKVLYDGRAIESSSFGQRCTAVVVILLLLGNNPIIIDEPEAHLDSLLISDYLVEVIKDRKQSRQIIFATHNANFVINGDAEQIHLLSIDETSGHTIVNSTTIENPDTREMLIALEGGRKAFKKRECRYQ